MPDGQLAVIICGFGIDRLLVIARSGCVSLKQYTCYCVKQTR